MNPSLANTGSSSRAARSASVSYGTVPKDGEAVLAEACPTVGSYGAEDTTLRGIADRLARADRQRHRARSFFDAHPRSQEATDTGSSA